VFMSPANYQLWKQIFLLKAHDFYSVQSSQSSPCPGTAWSRGGVSGEKMFSKMCEASSVKSKTNCLHVVDNKPALA